jgi:hypothetical protein
MWGVGPWGWGFVVFVLGMNLSFKRGLWVGWDTAVVG